MGRDASPPGRRQDVGVTETLWTEKMDVYNFTTVTQFILIGLSDLPEVRYPLFVAFVIIYQITLLGNGAILLAIVTERKLQTPMYYLLANLSLLDIFCPSATVPKMLKNLLTEDHSISFVGCALQLYFLVALAGTEVFLLAVMAYDRYVAICFPLRYSLIMTKVRCVQLLIGTWAAGFLNSFLHTMSTFSLSFCKSNRVNQYYCDIPPVVALSCSSTYVAEMLVLVVGGSLRFGRKCYNVCSPYSNLLLLRKLENVLKRKASYVGIHRIKNETPFQRDKMDVYNLTTVTQFILIGLSDLPEVRYPLFVAFVIIYQITLLGNGAILLAIVTERKLQTPMYYLLANLSLLDIFCPSATVPKMLKNLLTEDHSISFVGCALQLYFLVALAGTEVFLLAVMAYDRYVAICFPLRYSLIMTKVRCVQLLIGTWAAGFLNSFLHTMSTFSLSFCKFNRVNQYYCDIPPVAALSCSSTYVAEMLVLVVGGIFGVGAFLITLISYIYIVSTILKIQSVEGKRKAFSTCASHLLVVFLFYGTAIFTYIRPSSSQHSPARDRLISMLYAVITPMLNPIIYSLRNTEVKGALRKVFHLQICPQKA
ncbi:hypothetical protein STEG23_012897 [Scotinomys teguina]